MLFPDDDGLVAVLRHFAIDSDAVLGHGGEAWVYALDDARVVRVLHSGGSADDIERRQRLVDELARAPRTFALPEVFEVGEIEGRVFAIERRLVGRGSSRPTSMPRTRSETCTSNPAPASAI